MNMRKNRFGKTLQDAGASKPSKRRTPEQAAKLLLSDEISDYDRHLITNTVSELYETAKLLRDIRTIPKVTVFGSARTAKDKSDYKLCRDFCKQMADLGYMIITGAGPGIMAAGHEGAGGGKSIGMNIDLPFEQSVNPYSAQSRYLITYRYFFSRKLSFVREADAVVLFPGGFGTMDEAFEVLTLMQTGRSMPVPFVLMDAPGSTYWQRWVEFVKKELLENKMISPEDMYLFRRFHTVEEAVDYIHNFYRRYHSLRYIGDKVVLRLNRPIPPQLVADLEKEYKDFLGGQKIALHSALPEEADEPLLAHLPRLVLRVNRDRPVQLYCFIRSLNREVIASSTRRQDRSNKTCALEPHENPRPVRKKTHSGKSQ